MMHSRKNIPKHTFILKEEFDSLENKEKDTGCHIVEQSGLYASPYYLPNSQDISIVNPVSKLKFLGAFDKLPDPNSYEVGDIIYSDNKTYINVDNNWEIIDNYTAEPYNNTPKMIPQSFGNCCNCGAPLSGDPQCEYCGTYNGKYTG